jgi:cell division protein FtsQ
VLDDKWLARTLELPGKVSLMELDLEKLRARVLADHQVLTATLAREFPDKLVVHVTERTPVARVRVGHGGSMRDLLVARDGVLFCGTGFDGSMIDALPWLSGISLVPEKTGYRPIARMDVVSRLLADHLYRTWQIVSLARLEADDELDVTTKDNTTIVFSAKGEYFIQIANLDYIMERRAHLPPSRTRIDLSLGREVPVMIRPLTAADAAIDLPPHLTSPFLPSSPPSQLKTKREL